MRGGPLRRDRVYVPTPRAYRTHFFGVHMDHDSLKQLSGFPTVSRTDDIDEVEARLFHIQLNYIMQAWRRYPSVRVVPCWVGDVIPLDRYELYAQPFLQFARSSSHVIILATSLVCWGNFFHSKPLPLPARSPRSNVARIDQCILEALTPKAPVEAKKVPSPTNSEKLSLLKDNNKKKTMVPKDSNGSNNSRKKLSSKRSSLQYKTEELTASTFAKFNNAVMDCEASVVDRPVWGIGFQLADQSLVEERFALVGLPLAQQQKAKVCELEFKPVGEAFFQEGAEEDQILISYIGSLLRFKPCDWLIPPPYLTAQQLKEHGRSPSQQGLKNSSRSSDAKSNSSEKSSKKKSSPKRSKSNKSRGSITLSKDSDKTTSLLEIVVVDVGVGPE